MVEDFYNETSFNQVTISKLTQRQTDIIELISRAYTNEEIANILCISKDTVKTHLKLIYSKFDFSYCNRSGSVYRLKIALLWRAYKNRIMNLKQNEIIEC